MESGTLRNPLLEQQQGGSTETIAGQVLRASCVNYGRQRTLARLQSTRDVREQERLSVSIVSRLSEPIVQVYNRFIQEVSHFWLPAKAGLAGSICSVLCFVPGALSVFNTSGSWAVIIADLTLETTVGLTIRQGINFTLGTLAATALAMLVNFFAQMFGEYEPYYVVFWVFLGGALATMFKFTPPFKDRWNLAVAWSMPIFHVLILSKFEQKDKLVVPIIWVITILVGFLTASLINLSIAPRFAGTTINELVAKNFERTGHMMEKCVIAYCKGIVLEEMRYNFLTGSLEDENVHKSFEEIISTYNEVNKLLKAVAFEPCHGKFFSGYPWDMYRVIGHSLIHAVFEIVQLDSCLHSEIQAPLHLRQIFEDEFLCIGKELGQVFHNLGESIRGMKHEHSLLPMQQAEEGALLLQHKIAKYTSSVISGGNGGIEIAGQDPDAHKSLHGIEGDDTLSFEESSIERSDSSRSDDDVKSKRRSHLVDGHQDFLQRQETMNRNWDKTVQRIAAMSLIKFSSLLVELVVKVKFLVPLVDELEHRARFEQPEGNSMPSSGIVQV
jgi:hypothetical protein